MRNESVTTIITKAQERRAVLPPVARQLIRKEARVTQLEIAQALGVTRAAVSRWESGDRTPRGEKFEKYLELLERLGSEVLV